MALTLDNVVHSCEARTGCPAPMNAATAYLFAPIPAGVNPAGLTVEINGRFEPRQADKTVFLYRPGDKPGTWELLSHVTESFFEDSFDYQS